MLYDGDNRIISLVNAEQLCWQPGSFDVKPRRVCALAFRIKGTADMYCAGRRYLIEAGDILYMPQGLGYQVDYSQTEMLAFHFITERDDSQPEVYSLPDRSDVHRLFLEAAELWKNKTPGYVNYCTGILYQLLGHICQQCADTQMPPHFKKCLDHIHQNFRQPIQIAELCRLAGISPSAFRQLFHIYFGKTPTAYIRQLRLEYARNLIAGGMNVEAAAEQCGIGDPKYFARLIRASYGCTPRQLKYHGK